MGDVPVAATLNVAVCPDVTVWLAGCDVIDGASVVAVTWVPIPLKLTDTIEPSVSVKARTPE
jgi:hypothetical protein